MKNDKMCVLVASGKQVDFELPEGYSLIQVGSTFAEKRLEGALYDNEGDNISDKNRNYCELTALYWGWKNSQAKIKGLCHYRRYFAAYDKVNLFDNHFASVNTATKYMLSREQIEKKLQTADVILPMPYCPYPKTGYEDLLLYVYDKDIQQFREVLRESFPEYVDEFEAALTVKNMSYCNMMIAKADIYDQYCEWVFDILGKYEEKICLNGYDKQHARIYGYISEILLNVWVKHHHLKAAYQEILAISEYWNEPDKAAVFEKVQQVALKPVIAPLYRLYYKMKYPKVYAQYKSCAEFLKKEQNEYGTF